ncbi:MAG: efflux RND transporter permease subunit, partial [Pseudomonadota bacterium]
NNNLLIAAGEVETAQGSFAVKIPSSFDEPQDVYNLPVKTDGDRVITLGDLATIRLTFEDREGTARFNGVNTVALQVVKRKGFNLIDTAALVKEEVELERASWPPELQAAIQVGTSNDQSRNVASMVSQLEGSVLTAIALVMIVVLAALGTRPALLVGFAIPTSFLLCFALLAVMEISISNIVMFGLILAVGMLVDGAIVVVEYADKRIREGTGPMHAYVEAAKRMFWPIISSTATTLCAFLPMLFWPGVPGQFMGMLPVTLIFVLSASLVVALIYLPVMGGVTGRLERWLSTRMGLIAGMRWYYHLVLFVVAIAGLVAAAAIVPLMSEGVSAGFGAADASNIFGSLIPNLLLAFVSAVGLIAALGLGLAGAITLFLCVGAIFHRIRNIVGYARARLFGEKDEKIASGYRRTLFGHFMHLIVSNPIGPLVSVGVIFVVVCSTFIYYGSNNNGVEFFVESEPEQAIVYVRARGNLSLAEKDALVRQAEDIVLAHPGVITAFAFAGDGGLNTDASGAAIPADTIGQVQLETIPWEDRAGIAELDGDVVLDELQAELATLPGIETEILAQNRGPASGKPVHLRLKGDDWDDLLLATSTARAHFDQTPGLITIEDSLPLPGIDWQIDVDVEKAGRFGADVATVGAMVQMVTRGILLDTMRVDTSDEEIEIRVRLPAEDRVLSTLDSLRVRTNQGLVPLSNFITRTPVAKLAQIDRIDQMRYFDVKADVGANLFKLVDGETQAIVERINDEATGMDRYNVVSLEAAANFTELAAL